jgi:hypothetical protein
MLATAHFDLHRYWSRAGGRQHGYCPSMPLRRQGRIGGSGVGDGDSIECFESF